MSARGFNKRLLFERLVLGHLAGYPLAFLWAVASIPLTIHLFFAELAPLESDPALMGKAVVRLVAWPAGAVFLLAHVVGLAGGLAQDPLRGKRIFFGGLGALAGMGLLAGAGSWLWLFLR